MELDIGGKTCSSTFSCYDLETANWLPVLNGTAVAMPCGVFNTTGRSKSCHSIKEGHPRSIYTFCEIVYATKIHTLTSCCFKVHFVDDVAHV